ncbi:MAG: cellulose synthase catalytic subunit [Proteobacteria bacterium]|nr:cellulose synthase catalytic subunit [Pseudomonadota bacterium]
MRENPRLLLGAASPRLVVVEPAGSPAEPARRREARIFSLMALVLGLAYLIWLSRLVLVSRGSPDIFFFAAESLSYLLLCLLSYSTWRLWSPRLGNPESQARLSVDILVPCCGEPLEIIQTTLKAVRRITYHPLEVYVLDDAGSEAVAGLAQSLGFHYLSRPQAGLPRADSKSGNLNFGMSESRGELILVLDADQVPAPEILNRLVGFFGQPQVGYVQSKQAFFLPEGDPFYNRDKVFYETIQLSNDQANAVISCGSGVIYRRQALEEIGGFASWNLLEDFTSSYELASRGWRGVYYPHALSRGLAPATLAGVYHQRFQWCLDTMRLFFWDNPLFKSGLSWQQKTNFLVVMMSYLTSGLVFPVFYTAPLLVYWGGQSCVLGDELTYGVLRGAYLLATILMFRYLFFGKEPLRQFKMLCSLFPVHAVAIVAALLYPPGRKPVYRVNNLQPFASQGSWWHLAPHLGFISLHVSLPVLALLQGWGEPRLIFFNSIFSALIIWIMGDLVLAVMIRPKWRPAMDPRQVYG